MALMVIDCFGGAGGLSLGLAHAGLEPVAAFDFDADAVATYAKNLGGHVLHRDVHDLTGRELLGLANLDVGECDVLAGGPPCQGFSRQRRGDDDDDRNDLVLEFRRLVAEIRPRWFVMENVAALAGRRGRPTLDAFVRAVGQDGYACARGVFDAAHFGVPQHRKRLIVVGRLGAEPVLPQPTHDAPTWLTVRDAIADLPCPFLDPRGAAQFLNHDRDNISDLNRQRIATVPEGGGRADIPLELRLPCHQVSVETAGHRAVYGRLWWDRPAATITTKCNSFTRGRFAHPNLDRNITMREAARLQGFPDDFGFEGGKVPVAHQIGNAVPPPLAEAIGRAIVRADRSA
jgi:DNA (cytosine-5)-methyltransferase 1